MKDDSAPPSGGVGSSRWKELIEVASPISGRELDPTLPPLVPRPTLPIESHTPLWWGAVLDPVWGNPVDNNNTNQTTHKKEGGCL